MTSTEHQTNAPLTLQALEREPHRLAHLDDGSRSWASVVRNTARRVERGVTLVEILVVIAIMSLVSAGVGFAVIPKFKQAQIDTATNNMREVRNAVSRWKAVRGGEDCPTVSTLVQDKEIDSASKTDDPWGSAYKILCQEDEVVILSPGPDKREGTADDISVPKTAVTRR